MRVLLSTYGSRGDVEPLVGLAVALRELGAEVQVCAPPDEDFAQRLAGVGVPMVPFGQSARALTTAAAPSSTDLPRRASELIASQFAAINAAAEGCDALVATGVMPAAAGARSVAEKLGIRYVYATFQQLTLPSPYHPPLAYPGRPFPPEVTDNRVLWDLDSQSIDALFGEALDTHRASIGLPPVDNVRDYVIGEQPWLATDPALDLWQKPADLDVVQTGAWILPDERPLPDDLVAFLDAGTPPVYVGFGSMPMRASTDVAQVAVEVIRAQGNRALVSRGWADLALIDDRDDCFVVGEVNQQALFARVAAVVHHGGAGTTTTATRAGAPQVVIPQAVDQPYWAGRVAELGIGTAHDGPTPTFESLSAALGATLTAETRARAIAVAAAIRTDGAMVAAKLLLDATSRESGSTITNLRSELLP
ncbi:MAG: glycosyltransferase [Rhodococcus sp. (in: high G+C Gram-positive bacteria)]|nr:MAG: glycosyltransferase [Rhodococcus sp. (in: high G+C Gram-positive bacteria)]